MLTPAEFQRSDGLAGWRALNGGAFAWFEAPSHAAGAELLRRISPLGTVDVDLRRRGVRVRIGREPEGYPDSAVALARAISGAASELPLVADPAALRSLQLTLDARDIDSAAAFWGAALGFERTADDLLADPERRLPRLWLQEQDDDRALRQRIHLDISRHRGLDPDGATAAGGRFLEGPYGLRYADAEGNEADLIPTGPLGSDDATSDWLAGFAGMVRYPSASPETASELAARAAELADEAGIPLAIDVRAGALTIDSGKDRWEEEPGFEALATAIQAEARALGLAADPTELAFLQSVIDAADIETVRSFWRQLLVLEEDPRPGVTDLVDPAGLVPVLVFQDLAEDDQERRQQRNRFHLDLFVPDDQAEAYLDRALAAGGRIVYDAYAPDWWTIADPEGNEVCIAVAAGREERSS